MDVVVKVVLFNGILFVVGELGGDTLLLIQLQPCLHFDSVQDFVIVNLVTTSDQGVEGLGIVRGEEIVPKRVGTLEVLLGILDIGGESVARVEGPVEGLIQGRDEEVPLLGLVNTGAGLCLEPVLDVLFTMGQELELDIVSVKVVALPCVQETGSRKGLALLLGGVANDQTWRIMAVSDDQGGTDPFARADINILESKNRTGLELGRRPDVGVFLTSGFDGSILDTVFVVEQVTILVRLDLVAVGILNVQLFDVVLVVLASDKVGEAVSGISEEGHGVRRGMDSGWEEEEGCR